VISESQATEASDKIAPETQESQMTPSPVPTARRSFEDVSPIPSTSPTNKRKYENPKCRHILNSSEN
jgi:hypothetical protein